jgi:hypothetical protein
MEGEWTEPKMGNFPSAPFSRVDRRSQMRCGALDETPFEGVTGNIPAASGSDGVLLAVVAQARVPTSPLGWIDSWQAVAFPCLGGRTFSRPSHT